MRFWIDKGYVFARRVVVSVIGATLVLLGVVLLVTPGPGVLILAAGLGVLALEFTWARRWLRRLRDTASEAGRAAGITGSGEAEPGTGTRADGNGDDHSSTSSSSRF